MIRLAYILGNLTTNFEEARQKLCEKENETDKSSFMIITELALHYLEKDSGRSAANGEDKAGQEAK